MGLIAVAIDRFMCRRCGLLLWLKSTTYINNNILFIYGTTLFAAHFSPRAHISLLRCTVLSSVAFLFNATHFSLYTSNISIIRWLMFSFPVVFLCYINAYFFPALADLSPTLHVSLLYTGKILSYASQISLLRYD